VRAIVFEILAVTAYLTTFAAAISRMAAVRLYWFDEIFTLHLSRFESPTQLWHWLANGADNNPPLSYLLTAASVAIFGESEWSLRLPAIAGALLASVCLYLFVRRRRGPSEAFLAMAAIGPTQPIWSFFLEARPYGLAIGFTALALLSWQRATAADEPDTASPSRRGAWKTLFAASLVMGMATHYFFVVPILALGVGELVRTISRRKLDLGIALGFALSVVTLALLHPLWGHGSAEYAPGFWAKVKLTNSAIEDAFFGMTSKTLMLPMVLALTVGIVAGRGRAQRPESSRDETEKGYPLWEAMALAVLAVSPAIGVALGAKVIGAYYYRYTLPAVIGLAAVLAFAISRACGQARWGCWIASLGFAFTGAAGQWSGTPHGFRYVATEVRELNDALDRHAATGTVLIESPSLFMRAWHYHGDHSARIAFACDLAREMKHTNTDTAHRGLQALNRVSPVPLMNFEAVADEVKAGRPLFYFGAEAWPKLELESLGVSFTKVEDRPNGALYRLGVKP